MGPIINNDRFPMPTANSPRQIVSEARNDRISNRFSHPTPPIRAIHIETGGQRRTEAEQFVQTVFRNRYDAQVSVFAPRLLMLEQDDRTVAVAGWRGADAEPLSLENYLDAPIEAILRTQTGQDLARERIVEVGNLASEKPGGSLQVILNLARHLDESGYEWVVFTATQELIGIFAKLGLPLLALAKADPARLGNAASDWGSYYDAAPVVVAGRIRIALERFGSAA